MAACRAIAGANWWGVSIVISAKAILPGPFDRDAFQRAALQEINRFSDEIKKDFEKTVATWDEKPRFVTSILVNADAIRSRVHTAPIGSGKPPELIYYFISKGTDIRYAHMTPDFEPKTRVRVIDSFPGRGGLDSVDVRFPMPGIVGRQFDDAIATKHRARFALRIAVAIRNGARASGHLYR